MLAGQLGQPEIPDLIWCFLYQQENPESLIPLGDLLLNICPTLSCTKVYVYPSVIATYFALMINLGLKVCFENGYVQSTHGKREVFTLPHLI